MISVLEAKQIVRDNCTPLTPVEISIQDAAGYVLAEDIYASIDIPAFNQSAMDGYAFCYDDFIENNKLEIVGEVPAGHQPNFSDLKKKAVRIFTGAPVPTVADTVVMQEKSLIENNHLIIKDEQLLKGSNVRPKGAEIQAGMLALKEGTYLSPAAVGFLAGLGTSVLKVHPKPTISIVVTGKELQQPGQVLQPGQVYESNSVTVKAALKQLNIEVSDVVVADDDIEVLQKILKDALQKSDVVLLTGGVSVGDYDFVIEAAKFCGVTTLFHKIKQRPGKPLYFGKKGEKVVFGLPGNPSSVLTCVYQYVYPAIEALTSRKELMRIEHLPLTKSYAKKPGLTHFLKGFSDGKTATPLGGQESFKLSSFATANCLICLQEDRADYREGEMVEIHMLPL